MTFISIIIPVYNAEDFLDSCVASVKAQSWQDWEVILVDDGSSDSSPTMCDDYARDDDRIKVIHQANAGTSAARNTGIAAATGHYVTFMDNDDWWIGVDCLETIASSLRERPVDLLCHMSCSSNYDGTEITDAEPTDLAQKVASLRTRDAIRFLVDSAMITSAVWTKIVRRGLLDDHMVFPAGMRNEDTDWSAKVIAACESVGWIDKRFYAYRQGHSYAQTSHRLSQSSVDDLQRILEHHAASACALPLEKAHAVRAFLAYPFVVWVGQASALGLFKNSPQRAEALRRLAPLLQAANRVPVRQVRWVARIGGIRVASFLLGLAFKKKYPQHRASGA
ncbi:glycosyltransferase [Trueperella pecoris]|uniref:Glycosyltransferase n=1 Tax=Trueperella pecoris TaxID=2733571 RepID=A0A7M1R457_9ACTO|nr:glycosyltransferase [Trueperella pecoris]QOR48297.1 glycosyltransferase [Trueperella pecoris]